MKKLLFNWGFKRKLFFMQEGRPSGEAAPLFDKLIFSTRGAMWMLDLVNDDMSFAYSAAWNRYFGDYPVWYKSGANRLAVAAQIQRKLQTSCARNIMLY